MQRARRLALVVVLVLVGGMVLAGCRSQPGVAAYVGDKEYTVRQVDEIVDRIVKLNTERSKQPPDAAPPQIHISPQIVLGLLVYSGLLADLAAERGLTAAGNNVRAAANAYGLPAGDRYVQVIGTYVDRYQAVQQSGSAEEATREQLLRYYRIGVESGVYPPGVPDDAVVSQLDPVAVGAAFAVQAMIQDAAKKAGLVVNPRYAPLPLPILIRGQVALLPFGTSGESFVSGA